jgi:hypothetical protein
MTARLAAPPPDSAARPGVVLLMALLVLLALALAGAAMGFVAAQQNLIASRRTELLRARLAAEAGIARALAEWPPPASLPGPGPVPLPWATGVAPPHARYRTTAELLDGGLALLRAEGEAGRGTVAVASLLVRIPDADTIAAAIVAAIEAAGGELLVTSGALLDATGTGPAAGASPDDGCTADDEQGGDAIRAGDRAVIIVEPDAGVHGDIAAGAPSGMLERFAPLVELAMPVPPGVIRPAPVSEDDRCVTGEPANWGAPRDPGSPCGGHFPFLYSPGPLEMAGEGQGILYVAGDLLLRRGALFHGLILVAGAVHVEERARLEGAAVTAGESLAASRLAGEVVLGRCALRRALAASPLARPRPRSPRAWVPAF